MKPLLVLALLAGIGILPTTDASAQTTPLVCQENFARSEAYLTCRVNSVEVVAGRCQMQIPCQRNNGATYLNHGSYDVARLQNLCNRDGMLVYGCPPRP
ncbi:hypothetical protein LI078_19495 [Stenotrophomonas maltophilia]|uniref:NADH:ubiquinone oxidoreductase n=2 Tax=Stenotrophomonas TaxID=40323 RepID=A0A0L8A6J5_9GAMM|nr:hypothetical protein [Stenotrophomonas geniculata]MBH1639908.1 hypothetical protein [Stenotrophomonas maltophilia]KOE97769.1 hypothetical protein W7K_18415 [Stenotrophomonas geniculata N1]MBN5130807.1 hypothetical protein [Stenotrophomonas maltophilia]MBN5134079.1 hypothetical protein [Stenotrophomonas maltophilia]MCB7148757.1 hypothetical protein [Stenotrophomonas maltophilia]